MNDLMQKIKDICTYHGDEGTSGYLLSEEQFNQIEKLLDEAIDKTNKRWIERAKRSLETYVWDGNIGDGLAKDGGHDYLVEVMENRKLLTKKVLSDLLKG